MTIDFDYSRAPRTPSALRDLVLAVFNARDEDEAHWIEWKGSLSLDKAGRRFTAESNFAIARQILGFANRLPKTAHRYAEGVGYILVGVEPGCVQGTIPLDHADLENGLRAYLGTNGPNWSPQHVQVEAKTVLVITVEAPSDGEPPYVLQKEYTSNVGVRGAASGAIFVRRHAQVAIADAGEVTGLIQRLSAGKETPLPEVAVSLSPNTPHLPVLDTSTDVIDRWLRTRRDRLISSLTTYQEEAAKTSKGITVDIDKLAEQEPASVDIGMFRPPSVLLDMMRSRKVSETRSPAEYVAEVEKHLAACKDRLRPAMLYRLLENDAFDLKLIVENLSTQNLPDVRLTIYFPGKVETKEADDIETRLPAKPRKYGDYTEPSELMRAQAGLRVPTPIIPSLATMPTRQQPKSTYRNGGSTTQVYDLGHLRPQGRMGVSLLPLVADWDYDGDAITASWKVTSTGVNAVLEGTITIPLKRKGTPPESVLNP